MWERIEQGIITGYSNKKKPRTCNVLQVPDGYLIRNVRLPNTLAFQTKPQVNSVVFVIMADHYQSYILSVVRDPGKFLGNAPQGVKGLKQGDEDLFPEGEIYLESRGDPDSPIAGTGSTLHLANDGTIALRSGRRKESIEIGGEETDDDGEIVITADNVFVESNVNQTSNILSTFRFDEDNKIEIGNFKETIPQSGLPSGITELEVNNIVMDSDGEISIFNKDLLGVEKNNITMSPGGTTTVDANIINLNNGVNGAARLEDKILIDNNTDATYLGYLQALDSFMASVFTIFNGHVHTGNLGNATSPPLTPLVTQPPTSPSTITGKINESSNTVKIGD